MPRSWSRFTVAVLLTAAAACRTPAHVGESGAERLSGCLRRIYGDGPPGSAAGRMWFTLTTDSGATTLLDVSPSLIAAAGGPSLLDGARVSVVLDPSRESSGDRPRTTRVREIRREARRSGAPC